MQGPRDKVDKCWSTVGRCLCDSSLAMMHKGEEPTWLQKMWCTGCLNGLCVAVMFGGWTLQHPDFQGQRSLGPFFRLAQARLTSEVGGKWCLVVCIMKLLVVYNWLWCSSMLHRDWTVQHTCMNSFCAWQVEEIEWSPTFLEAVEKLPVISQVLWTRGEFVRRFGILFVPFCPGNL